MHARGRHVVISLLLVASLAGCDYFVSAETRVERAQEHIQRGEYRHALLELRNALKDRPDLERGRLLLAEVAIWQGDVGGADTELRRISPQVDPAKYADIEARVDIASGRDQKLLDRLNAGNSPLDQASQAMYRGLAQLGLNQPAAAAESFRAALKADPKRVAATTGLVQALAAQNQMQEALQVGREAVEAHPDQAMAWFAQGTLLAYQRDASGAADALKRASELAPRQLDVPTQVSLAAALVEVRLSARDIQGAREGLAILNRVAPRSRVAAIMASRVDLAANDFQAAATQLHRMVNASPDDVQARFLLAVAMMSQGNLEQASAELNHIVQQVPEHLEARELLARVRLQLQDPDGAMRALVPALQSGSDERELGSLFDVARARTASNQSIPMLEKALAAKPESGALQVQLASAYLQAGNADKARELLSSKSDDASDSRRLMLRLEATLRSQGQAAAIADAERKVASNPADVRTRIDVAAFYLRMRDAAKATAHLEAARQQSADAVEPRLLLARLALSRNDAKRADELVGEVLKGAPGRADVLSKVGLLYLDAGRFDRAVEHLRAGVGAAASDASMWLNLGRAQAALGETGPARQALEKALSLRPNWIAAVGVLVFMDLQSGQREAALKRIADLKTAAPKDPNVHALEGEVNLVVRDYSKAAGAFQKAYEIFPTAPLAAKSYQARSAGKLPAPAKPLEDWLARHPDDLPVRALLAEAYLHGADRTKASDQYERILARQPANVAALNNLAWLHYEQKEYPKALELARRALSAAPRSAAVNDTLGWILVESGRVQEGLPILKSASEQPDSTPEILYHYAAGLARAGSSDEARSKLQSLLRDAAEFSSRKAAEELFRKLTPSGEQESRG